MINTAKVSDRRELHFESPADLYADLARLESAAKSGSLRTTGNWSPGQIFGHLATWIEYSFDGPPVRPPWVIKLFMKTQKRRYLRGPLPVGVKIPGVDGGTFGFDEMTFEEGASRLRQQWKRLESDPPEIENVLFGKLSHEEWIQLHLRHAELHLSFLHGE